MNHFIVHHRRYEQDPVSAINCAGPRRRCCPGQTDKLVLAGIAHVAIRVSDLNRSRDFYQKLGFEQAFTFTKDGVVTESFLKVNDQQFIEMYPQQQPSQSIGFMHICFEGADLKRSITRTWRAAFLLLR